MNLILLLMSCFLISYFLNKELNMKIHGYVVLFMVWSDLKNNTKRKAAKIQRASLISDQSASTQMLKLTYIEQKVLNIMGYKTAGKYISIEAANISEDNVITQDSDRTIGSLSSPPSPTQPDSSPPFAAMQYRNNTYEDADTHSIAVGVDQQWEEREHKRQLNISPIPISESPTESDFIIPDLHGHIPKTRNQVISSRTKLSRRKYLEKTTETFIKYIIEKNRTDAELEKKRLELRETELDVQKQWQEVAMRAIDALHKVIDSKFS